MKKTIVVTPAQTRTALICDLCGKEKADIKHIENDYFDTDICKDCLDKMPKKIREDADMFNEFLVALGNSNSGFYNGTRYSVKYPLDNTKIYVFVGGKEDAPLLIPAESIDKAKRIVAEENEDEDRWVNGIIINGKLVQVNIKKEVELVD